jgi:predicted dehydrogenase
MALKAGKHVISEKPVSPDVATGRRLLAAHAGQVWMVAENFRYEDALVQATEVVQSGKIGRPLLFHWNFCIAMTPAANKYYHTDWRRSGEFPGGFILDGGVHNVAAFRMALGEVSKVNAVVVQIRSDLPPADTLSAILQFDSGVVGNWSVTYAGGAPWASPLHIAGENGIVRVDTGSLEITVQGKTHSSKFASNGVEAELAAFAAAIREGKPHRNTPAQALQDVAVIEALLKAAETGCSVNPERIV